MIYRWSLLRQASFPIFVALLAASSLSTSSARVLRIKEPTIISTVDTSGGSPDAAQIQSLQDISKKAEETGEAYYEKIVQLIGARRHPQPDKITISFNYSYKGVAATGGDHTDVSADYALKHPDDIPGVIVHELTHVAQHYTKDTGFDTGWLTEGIADYVRWFNFEPVSKRPHPHQSRNPKATGSYQTTAAFLYWAVNKYDKNLVKQLNEALYDGSYKGDIWQKLTGKSLGDLNTEWVATLEP